MHEDAESKLVELARPTVLLSCIYKLEILELDDAETNPPVNQQDNGAMTLVNTQPSLPYSPLEDALVSPYSPLTRPRIEVIDFAL